MTGDVLEAEPFCTHVPVRYRRMVERGEAEPVDEYFAKQRLATISARGLDPVAGRRRAPPPGEEPQHEGRQDY